MTNEKNQFVTARTAEFYQDKDLKSFTLFFIFFTGTVYL